MASIAYFIIVDLADGGRFIQKYEFSFFFSQRCCFQNIQPSDMFMITGCKQKSSLKAVWTEAPQPSCEFAQYFLVVC
jgi:hypothetical protein